MTEPTSDGGQLWTVFLFQLRSLVRTRRFLGILVFVALISFALLGVNLARGASSVGASNATSGDFLSGFLAYAADAIIITGALLGGDALAVDLVGGPGYLMLVQPVRRHILLLGRYTAAVLAGLAMVVLYYVVAVLAVQDLYGSVPLGLVTSLAMALLFLLSVLAVAFFCSSFFRSPTVSIIASLLLLILGLPILAEVGDLTATEPWFSLSYASGVLTNVLSSRFQHESISTVSSAKGVHLTVSTWSPFLWEGALIMAVYLAVFLALAFVIYRYREVKG